MAPVAASGQEDPDTAAAAVTNTKKTKNKYANARKKKMVQRIDVQQREIIKCLENIEHKIEKRNKKKNAVKK